MKLLHLPLNVPGSEQIGQEKGFRHIFEDYLQFDYLKASGELGALGANESLRENVEAYHPDIIWAQLQETNVITPETWGEIRRLHPQTWLTTWSGDARDYLPVGLSQILPLFDIYYNCTDQNHLYKDVVKRYEFMPIAIDPEEVLNFTKPDAHIPKVIFIGNNYGETFSNGAFRRELMHTLSTALGDKFGVFGTGWDPGEVTVLGSCPVKHQGRYYHQARVVISVDHIKDILHWSERLPWALASRTPTMVHYQRGIEEWFKDDNVCMYFDSAADCLKKIDYILSNRQWADALGTRAQRLVLHEHNWVKRAQQVRRDYETRSMA